MRLAVGLVLTGFAVLAIPYGGAWSLLDLVYGGVFILGAALIITSSHRPPTDRGKK